MKKKIFYWGPFTDDGVATKKAIINSAIAVNRYSSNFKTIILNAYGEWDAEQNTSKIKFINLGKKKINNLPKYGYINSRYSYLKIFFHSFWKLKKILILEKPDFLMVHLIVSLPLLLFTIFNFKTKLILRISGEPKLNFFRKFFWKVLSSKIYKVTCPSSKTREMLIKNSIFNANQVIVLLDPIVNIKKIKYYKNIDIDKDYINTNYFLAVGRLTKQKNFDFLISTFKIINNSHSDLELIILGEGEERENLETKIKELDLINIVHLKGFESNVFNYMKNAKCLILPSIYENPGHVLIEAAACNCPIISSNCPTGPAEFLSDGRAGFLFEVNNKKDLIKKTNSFLNQNSKETKKKKILAKKNSMNYTMFRHFRILRNIL